MVVVISVIHIILFLILSVQLYFLHQQEKEYDRLCEDRRRLHKEFMNLFGKKLL